MYTILFWFNVRFGTVLVGNGQGESDAVTLQAAQIGAAVFSTDVD
jgi:hypothetical protein